jgi:hypothetical protein
MVGRAEGEMVRRAEGGKVGRSEGKGTELYKIEKERRLFG